MYTLMFNYRQTILTYLFGLSLGRRIHPIHQQFKYLQLNAKHVRPYICVPQLLVNTFLTILTTRPMILRTYIWLKYNVSVSRHLDETNTDFIICKCTSELHIFKINVKQIGPRCLQIFHFHFVYLLMLSCQYFCLFTCFNLSLYYLTFIYPFLYIHLAFNKSFLLAYYTFSLPYSHVYYVLLTSLCPELPWI